MGYSPRVCKELDTTERQSSCTESAVGNTVLPLVRKRGDANQACLGTRPDHTVCIWIFFKEPNIYIYIYFFFFPTTKIRI